MHLLQTLKKRTYLLRPAGKMNYNTLSQGRGSFLVCCTRLMDQAAVVTGLRVSTEFGAVDRYAVHVTTCVWAVAMSDLAIVIANFPRGKNEAQKTFAMFLARAIPGFAGARSISCSLFQVQTAVVVENVEVDLHAVLAVEQVGLPVETGHNTNSPLFVPAAAPVPEHARIEIPQYCILLAGIPHQPCGPPDPGMKDSGRRIGTLDPIR